jgi:hypothetical protein
VVSAGRAAGLECQLDGSAGSDHVK